MIFDWLWTLCRNHIAQIFSTLPVDIPNYSVSRRPHVSLGIRVNSSSGLIFHVAGGRNQRTMMLSVFDSHLMLLVNGGKRKTTIRSRKKYSDALWHTVRAWWGFCKHFIFPNHSFLQWIVQVFVKVEGDRASLTVDGIDVQSKRASSGGGRNVFGAPLYIGGLPSNHSAATVNTVLGTLRSTFQNLGSCLSRYHPNNNESGGIV